ncbi:hypothetical protein ACED66_22175 [Vibrio splendidus]|uniref:Uncharacterized protein n=1 Tax=Vibrio splendidus TaxID=29497 RepID=A0A0H3ZX63_VIBSP|nr:hypothetical protein [Vibrio splendidus]AKN38464.1 hypothetical protein [Vibrio splendidus]AKN39783.1 hypothetical protein [Vibrio splendidus]PTP96456.1 hypothetical protein CWO28_22025 [Vibrio splendidus]
MSVYLLSAILVGLKLKMNGNLTLYPVEKKQTTRKKEFDDSAKTSDQNNEFNQGVTSNHKVDKLRFCEHCHAWTVNRKFGRVYTYEPLCSVCGADFKTHFKKWRLSNVLKNVVKLTWITRPLIAAIFVVFVVFVVFVQWVQKGA